MNEKFETLYTAHFKKLCEVAYRIVKDTEQAREIVQDVFVEFWKKRDDWEKIRSSKAFLITSVYNRSLNAVRQHKIFVDFSDAELTENHAGEEAINVEELMNCLAEGIQLLPEKCREIFLLSREEELTYAQIATHLQISIKTVENQMGIALKKLKNHINSQDRYPKKLILLLL